MASSVATTRQWRTVATTPGAPAAVKVFNVVDETKAVDAPKEGAAGVVDGEVTVTVHELATGRKVVYVHGELHRLGGGAWSRRCVLRTADTTAGSPPSLMTRACCSWPRRPRHSVQPSWCCLLHPCVLITSSHRHCLDRLRAGVSRSEAGGHGSGGPSCGRRWTCCACENGCWYVVVGVLGVVVGAVPLSSRPWRWWWCHVQSCFGIRRARWSLPPAGLVRHVQSEGLTRTVCVGVAASDANCGAE